MSKRLSVAEIREKIADLESRYHNGHKQSEEWWRVSGDVHPTDRMLWARYTKLLNDRLQELAVKHLSLEVGFDNVYLSWGKEGQPPHDSLMQWKTEDREVAEAYLQDIRQGRRQFRLPKDLEFLYEEKWAVKLYWEDARYEEDLDNQEEACIPTPSEGSEGGEAKMYFVHTYFFDTEAEQTAFVMGVQDARRYGRCQSFRPSGELVHWSERDLSRLP